MRLTICLLCGLACSVGATAVSGQATTTPPQANVPGAAASAPTPPPNRLTPEQLLPAPTRPETPASPPASVPGNTPPLNAGAAAQPNASPNAPCPSGSPAASTPQPSSPSGVSTSQLPRAGVPADAFVRPGVSAAQLAPLTAGAPPPCQQRNQPRGDVVLYPDTGRAPAPVRPASADDTAP